MVDNPQSSELNEETRNGSSNETEATSILAEHGSRVLDRRRMLEFTAGGAIALWGGVVTETAAAQTENGGELEWGFETGDRIYSSPTVVDGIVYVGSWDNNIYAVDVDTGDEHWRFETGDFVRSSPNVVNNTVYVGSTDDNVYALDAATGNEQWRFDAGTSVWSSPTVANGTVYVGSQTNTENEEWTWYIYAVDANTGNEQWRFETGDTVRSSPTVVDGTVYIGSADGNIYALNAGTGDEHWRFETGSGVISSPTVANGTVYTGDNRLYALDAATGDEHWRFDTEFGIRSSPTVVNGSVFFGSNDNHVYALDAATGDEHWRFETDASVLSSPTVADGTVYIGNDAHNIYALDAATGDEHWRFERGAGNIHSYSSPTVVNGTLYVGGLDGNLYAINSGVEGHSEDSRVLLGTLGHHHSWAGMAPPEPPIEEVCVDLIAGQNIEVGEVCIINDDDELEVTYEIEGDWEIIETHLAVGDDLEEYEDEGWVTPNGQPRPGRFPYSDDHGPTDEVTYDGISLEGRADELVVAAHAVVEREINDEIQEEGAWGEGDQFAERGGWAMYFEYEVQ